MKKWIESSIAVICLTVMTACGGSGGGNSTSEDNVVGKWKAQMAKEEAGGKIETTVNLNMKADKTMSMDVTAIMNGEQKGIKMKIPMNMGFDGKWDATSDKIVWTPDSGSSRFSVNKDSIMIELNDSRLNAMANALKDMLADELTKTKKSKMMLNFAPKDSMSYFFDKSQLVIISDNDTLRFDKN